MVTQEQNNSSPTKPVNKDDDKDLTESPREKNLVVKIKLPKKANDKEEDEEESTTKSHTCIDCHKTFTSGKALGGHRSSAHIQANKEQLCLNKLKSKITKSHQKGSTFVPNSHCKCCGKDFPSKKSLYGHMRTHPDRDWRGTEPPLHLQTEDDDDDDDDIGPSNPILDLSKPLGSTWTVTNKRGRRPCPKPVPDSGNKVLEETNVRNLLRLVEDGSRKRKIDEGDDQGTISKNNEVGNGFKEQTEDGSVSKKLKICDEKEIDNGKGKGVLTEPDHCDDSGFKNANLMKLKESKGAMCSTTLKPIEPELKLKETKEAKCSTTLHKRSKKSMESEDSPNSVLSRQEKFICTVCKKEFLTHQALGGHRSSHSKFKITIYNTIDERKNAKEFANTNGTNESGSSEQASTSTSAANEDTETALNNIVDFDLNEMPEGEDEDGILFNDADGNQS